MAIDERLRLNIHTKLTELLGSEEATALIEHIMPVPWHDVATKDDLQLMAPTSMSFALKSEPTWMCCAPSFVPNSIRGSRPRLAG